MSQYKNAPEKLVNELSLLRQRVRDLETQLAQIAQPQNEILANMSRAGQFTRANDGEILFTNAKFDTLFGYEAGEAIGKHHSVLIAPLYPDERIPVNKNNSNIPQGDLKTVRKDGTFFWSHVTVSSFHHSEFGDIWIAVYEDITARKHMEATLRASEERYRQMIEYQMDLICHYNANFEIVFANEAYCRTFGLTYDELVGQSILPFIPPDYVEHARNHVAQLAPDRLFASSEHPSFMPDGTVRWFQWQDQAMLNKHGEIIEYQAVGRDITERKKAEAALMEEQIVLQTLIDAIPDYIFVKDREGRFTVSNKAHTEASSVSSTDELMGKTAKDIFPAELADQFHHDDDEVMSLNQARISMERQTVDSDGNDKWVSTTKVPMLDENGEVKGLVGISRDITERKQAEDQIRESVEKFKTLFNMLPVGVSVLDTDRKIIEMNPALEVILDMPMSDITNEKYKSRRYIHGDGSPMDTSEFASSRALREQRIVYDVEIGIVKEDNTVIWTSVTAAPITAGNWSAVIVTTDITRRKEAEIAFLNSENRYGRLVQEAPVCIHEIGLDKNLMSMNSAGLAMLKLSREEQIIDMPMLNVVSAKDRDRINVLLDQAIAGADQFFEFETSSSPPRIFNSNFIPIKDQDGTVQKLMGITQDVTERRQAEKALRESETKYRDLVETSLGLIFQIDLEGRFTYLNPVYHAMTGYEVDEMLGRNFSEFVDPQTSNNNMEAFQDILKGQSVIGFESNILSKSGDRIDLIANAKPRFDIDGNIIGIQGTGYDITERKKAEQKLQESEAKYRDLVETSQGLIWQVDAQGRFHYLNPSWEETLGYTLDELLGHPFMNFENPEVIERDLEVFKVLLDGNSILGHETTFVTKSGDDVHLLFNAKALYDTEGQVIGTQGTAYDITERKKADQKLQESEAKYRDLVETSLGLIWRVDYEGRFTYLNPAWEDTFDYDLDEMLGHSFQEFEDPKVSEKNVEALIAVLQGQTIIGFETILFSKNGEPVYLTVNAKPLRDGNGTIIGTQGTAHDITELKKSETLSLDYERLRTQFQKEQEQTNVIQRIISTLSHDMRTPLAVISVARDMLDKYHDKLSVEKRQEKLDTIDHQLQFALQLLNDTVQVARGTHIFKPSLVNLATLCEISIHEGYLGQSNNHELIFINVGQIETVFIDETLVSRILLNLLSNAVKYSPDGGEIRLELDYYEEGVVLRLTDHGLGISEEDLPKIFDLLYRANTVQNILGTGLGLNIVKDCVERHSGEITVESELGKGSTFTVKIPLS